MSKKVVTFGEIMLRLAPEGYYRFVQADTFGATYGGGEANVAVSLANYGFDAKFVTKLPKHEIGQAAVNSLRKYGVDTSFIARGGDRVGIYFLEKRSIPETVQGYLRQSRFFYLYSSSGRLRLESNLRRSRMVPFYRNHTGAQRWCCSDLSGSL